MMKRKELVNNIVMAIYANLKGRRGVLDGIDDDVLGQIRSTMRKLVHAEFEKYELAVQAERLVSLSRELAEDQA